MSKWCKSVTHFWTMKSQLHSQRKKEICYSKHLLDDLSGTTVSPGIKNCFFTAFKKKLLCNLYHAIMTSQLQRVNLNRFPPCPPLLARIRLWLSGQLHSPCTALTVGEGQHVDAVGSDCSCETLLHCRPWRFRLLLLKIIRKAALRHSMVEWMTEILRGCKGCISASCTVATNHATSCLTYDQDPGANVPSCSSTWHPSVSLPPWSLCHRVSKVTVPPAGPTSKGAVSSGANENLSCSMIYLHFDFAENQLHYI